MTTESFDPALEAERRRQRQEALALALKKRRREEEERERQKQFNNGTDEFIDSEAAPPWEPEPDPPAEIVFDDGTDMYIDPEPEPEEDDDFVLMTVLDEEGNPTSEVMVVDKSEITPDYREESDAEGRSMTQVQVDWSGVGEQTSGDGRSTTLARLDQSNVTEQTSGDGRSSTLARVDYSGTEQTNGQDYQVDSFEEFNRRVVESAYGSPPINPGFGPVENRRIFLDGIATELWTRPWSGLPGEPSSEEAVVALEAAIAGHVLNPIKFRTGATDDKWKKAELAAATFGLLTSPKRFVASGISEAANSDEYEAPDEFHEHLGRVLDLAGVGVPAPYSRVVPTEDVVKLAQDLVNGTYEAGKAAVNSFRKPHRPPPHKRNQLPFQGGDFRDRGFRA